MPDIRNSRPSEPTFLFRFSIGFDPEKRNLPKKTSLKPQVDF
jgi:hypothetical protein